MATNIHDSSIVPSRETAARGGETPVRADALDHVAVRVPERDAVAAFLVDRLGMHVIDRTDRLTLVGGDARRGKITLFDSDAPRPPGILERIVLRVPSIADYVDSLSIDREVPPGEMIRLPEPVVPLGLVERRGCDVIDLDHVVLRVVDPEATARELERLGFANAGRRLLLEDRELVLVPGAANGDGPPLLDHIGLLVDSSSEAEAAIERLGLEVDDVVETDNTRAVFVVGPAGMRLEYVEHKPGFSLV